MQLTQLTLTHSNPSLGPHETIITISLAANKEHQERIDRFLDEAQLNGITSLRGYIEAVHRQDKAILEQVEKTKSTERLAVGGTITKFSLQFADQPSIHLGDVYRRYQLTHFYPEFTRYMVEHGHRTEFSPRDFQNPTSPRWDIGQASELPEE